MKASGDAADHIPTVIDVHAGDATIVRRDDQGPHMIRYAYRPHRQTARLGADAAGGATSSGGCAAHAAAFHDVTSVFAAEA